jgi:hypothetical protein
MTDTSRKFLRAALAGAFLVACQRPESQVPTVAGFSPGVSFGTSTASVLDARPAMQFRPYSGWVELLTTDSTFETIVYEFDREPPAEGPSQGQLTSVNLKARSIPAGQRVFEELKQRYGAPRGSGCTTAANDSTEIAFTYWRSPGATVLALQLRQQTSTQIRPAAALAVTFAAPTAELSDLLHLPRKDSCFKTSMH